MFNSFMHIMIIRKRKEKDKMTLEERVAFIKESLNKMSQEEFDQMLERNGYRQIKEGEDTIFYKALSPIESEGYYCNLSENNIIFENDDKLDKVA